MSPSSPFEWVAVHFYGHSWFCIVLKKKNSIPHEYDEKVFPSNVFTFNAEISKISELFTCTQHSVGVVLNLYSQQIKSKNRKEHAMPKSSRIMSRKQIWEYSKNR